MISTPRPLSALVQSLRSFRPAPATQTTLWLLLLSLAGHTPQAFAATGTTTTLTVTAAGAPVTTIPAQTVVTLTATVTAGTTPITLGQVNFCDATATYCTDIHLLGTAQITKAGTATYRFVPGIGSHTYKAVFFGTTSVAASTSSALALTVTGSRSSTTSLISSGAPGNYTLSATVTGSGAGGGYPSGNVAFSDSSNSAFVLGSSALATGTAGLGFSTSYVISSMPYGVSKVAVGDFNGDGRPDYVIGDGRGALYVGLGKGDGTLQSLLVQQILLYSATEVIAVGDFNSDGKLDLVVGDYNSSVVQILLGNGDGTFSAGSTPSVGLSPLSIAVGDWNHDGKLDLVIGSDSSSSLTVLLGNGDGTFSAAASPPLPSSCSSLVVGDFNGDGNLDVAAVTYTTFSSVVILTGQGDGTFAPFTTIFTGSSTFVPYYLQIGDFNQDGHQDLALIASNSTSVPILLGKGDGTFTRAVTTPAAAGVGPGSIVVGDFNGDGIPDIATQSGLNNTTKGATVFLGVGDGSFSTAGPFIPNSYSYSLAAADFNGDGTSDLIYVGLDSSNTYVPVYTQLSQVTSTATTTLTNIAPVGTGPHQINATYSGDNNFKSSTSSVTLTAQSLPTTLVLSTVTNGTTFGQQAQFSASLSPYTAQGQTTNNESVTFSSNGTYLGLVTLTSGLAALNVTSLPTGSDTIVASYSGDANFMAAKSNPVSFKVTQATPTISWATPASIVYGTPLLPAQLNATASTPGSFTYSPIPGTVLTPGARTLTATFTPTDTTDYTSATATVVLTVNKAPLTLTAANTARVFGAANPTFTGAVTGSVNGDTFTESFSTTATIASIIGTYSIVPAVAGTNLANYTVTPVNGALTITQAGTATTFALSNSNLTLTANVASLISGTPTGTVTFYEGQTAVGTGTLSNGSASFTATSAFPTGDVVVSAQYSGDVNFTQSASPPILVLAVSAASNALTVSQSGTVSDTLNVAVAPGYLGTVQFSCTGLPTDTTCAFSPASVTFSGTTGTASVTTTIQTGVGAHASLSPLPAPASRPLFLAACALWMPGLLTAVFTRRARRSSRPLQLLTLALLLSGCSLALTGCAGGTSSTPSSTTLGSSTIQVVASGTSGLAQTTSLTLTVQ